MKLTNVLFKQHIGFYFKKHWRIQGKRKVLPSLAQKILNEKGIPVYNSEEFLFPRKQFDRIEVVGYKPKPVALDETHPNWHDRLLLSYEDNDVLLEGLNQAKVLTNTVEVINGLPQTYKLSSLIKGVNNNVKNIILNSHLFDSEQVKLPKIKDPNRPAFNFPRVYGISRNRSSKLLISKLLQLIECSQSFDLVKERSIFHDPLFSFVINKEDLIQFQLKVDSILTSTNPLMPVSDDLTEDFNLPDLYPIKSTISLTEKNIYTIKDIYPFEKRVRAFHPHTIFIRFDPLEVKNLFEEEVTEDQIFARSLLKTFTVAASYARKQFGNDVKVLKSPVTLQCVQTDSRWFHFGVLQLNTLDLNDKVKNVWYQTKLLPLFESCRYEQGKPVLEGYNEEVVQNLFRLYSSL